MGPYAEWDSQSVPEVPVFDSRTRISRVGSDTRLLTGPPQGVQPIRGLS
jgi:hypothetical protein